MEKKKVLVVDDSLLIRKLLQDFLNKKGYTVLLAEDGKEALEMINKDMPDMMLLDITMPVMDGIEVLVELKKLNINLPVIIVTNTADIKIARETLEKGAYDYVTKPIDFDYLELSILAKTLQKTEK